MAFSTTLVTGVLISPPAQAFTLNAAQCARLAAAITYFEGLAAKYPDIKLIQLILQELKEVFADRC